MDMNFKRFSISCFNLYLFRIQKQVIVKIPFEDYNNEKYNPPLPKAAFAKIVQAGRNIRGEIKDLGQSYFLPGKNLQFKSKGNQHYENSAPTNYYQPLYFWTPQAAYRKISGHLLDAGQLFYNANGRQTLPYQLPYAQNNFVFQKNIKPQSQPHRTISKQQLNSYSKNAYQRNIDSQTINQFSQYHNLDKQDFSRNYYDFQRPVNAPNRYYNNINYGKQLNLSPLQVPKAVYKLQPKDNRKIIPVAAKPITIVSPLNHVRNTVEISNNSQKKTLSLPIANGSRAGKSLVVPSSGGIVVKKTTTKVENSNTISETRKTTVSDTIKPLAKSAPKNISFVNQETKVKDISALLELDTNLESSGSELEHSQIARQEPETSGKQILTSNKEAPIARQESSNSGKQTLTSSQEGQIARQEQKNSGKQTPTTQGGHIARQDTNKNGKQTLTSKQEELITHQEPNNNAKQTLISEEEGNLKITLPGKLVQRLKIVRGGTAIVGPQGVATASDGGTAIVGPDGVAYIKPNAVAIVGPGSRVVLLPVDLDFNRLINQLSKRYASQQMDMSGLSGEYVLNDDGSTIKQVFLPTGGKIVASGPIIYHDKPQPESETFFA